MPKTVPTSEHQPWIPGVYITDDGLLMEIPDMEATIDFTDEEDVHCLELTTSAVDTVDNFIRRMMSC